MIHTMHHLPQVCLVRAFQSERISSTLSPPFPSTSSSSHSSSTSCTSSGTSSCTSSNTLRAVASLCTPPKRVWTLLTTPTSSQKQVTQKLDEKVEVVRMARSGPTYDNEATALNRCVTLDLHAKLTRDTQSLHDASLDKPRRRKSKRNSGPRRTGAWWTESLPQRSSKIVIFVIRPTWHRIRSQVQTCSRKCNACGLHPSDANRAIPTQYSTSRMGILDDPWTQMPTLQVAQWREAQHKEDPYALGNLTWQLGRRHRR